MRAISQPDRSLVAIAAGKGWEADWRRAATGSSSNSSSSGGSHWKLEERGCDRESAAQACRQMANEEHEVICSGRSEEQAAAAAVAMAGKGAYC